MCHAQHRTASLLTVCLTLLFCCTVLALAPSADAAETTSPDDGLVLLSDGTGPSVSRPQRDCTGLLAERQSLIQAVQTAVDRTDGVSMGTPAVLSLIHI